MYCSTKSSKLPPNVTCPGLSFLKSSGLKTNHFFSQLLFAIKWRIVRLFSYPRLDYGTYSQKLLSVPVNNHFKVLDLCRGPYTCPDVIVAPNSLHSSWKSLGRHAIFPRWRPGWSRRGIGTDKWRQISVVCKCTTNVQTSSSGTRTSRFALDNVDILYYLPN